MAAFAGRAPALTRCGAQLARSATGALELADAAVARRA
jgi:hypothetical protein